MKGFFKSRVEAKGTKRQGFLEDDLERTKTIQPSLRLECLRLIVLCSNRVKRWMADFVGRYPICNVVNT